MHDNIKPASIVKFIGLSDASFVITFVFSYLISSERVITVSKNDK